MEEGQIYLRYIYFAFIDLNFFLNKNELVVGLVY